MQSVNIRGLMRHFLYYLKNAKEGGSFIILERNNPIVDINPNIRYPGWKRTITRRKIKGESFSKTTEKIRGE